MTLPENNVQIICTGRGRHHTDLTSPCELALITFWEEDDGSLTLMDRSFRDPGMKEWADPLPPWTFRTTPQRPIRAGDDEVWYFACRVCKYLEPVPNSAVNLSVRQAIAGGRWRIDWRPPVDRTGLL